MRKLFDLHREEIIKNTSLDLKKIEQVQYLHDFDREVQCDTWGYPTVGAYYRDASSSDSVLDIRTPTLCLHATDDPIAADEGVPYEEIRKNPYVIMCATNGGGHLCWFELGGGRWHSKPASTLRQRVKCRSVLTRPQATNFLNAMARDITGVQAPNDVARSSHGGHRSPFVFDPMRRKMRLADASPS